MPEQPSVSGQDRSDRLAQIRHLQTLRWAYLSTYLLAVAWFISSSFDVNSALRRAPLGVLLIGSGVALLGLFLGLRIRQYTIIIHHDLAKIRTSIRSQGWIEYVFVFSLSALVLIFSIIRAAIAILSPREWHILLRTMSS